MNSGMRASRVSMLCLVLLTTAVAGYAQQITFPDFSSTAGLQLNGSSQAATWPDQNQNIQHVLRLTDGLPGAEAGTAFFTTKQPVAGGFTTYFKFQMHYPTSQYNVADGIAFVVQNAGDGDSTLGGSGSGVTSLGYAGGGIGYTGIPNSLAIEFDIYGNAWDPESPNLVANHVAIQTCGTHTNAPAHKTGTALLNVSDVPNCLLHDNAINTQIPKLDGLCNGSVCADGDVHEVVIEYTAPSGDSTTGRVQVWIDPTFVPATHTPDGNSHRVLDVPYTIGSPSITSSSTELSLDGADGSSGSAWVGFSGGQGASTIAQDIFAWEYTPHVPTQVEQPIPPGGTTAIFNFGSHNLKVTYPVGFVNTGNIVMEVTATPISPTAFQSRVAGTPFANEQCIVYEGTGGNCIVYSVVCEDPDTDADTPCPSEPTPTIDIKTSYDTTQTITSPDFLKADPIGSNNWFSIFESFVPQKIDGTTAGKGNNFSDLVATFGAPTSLPAPAVTCTPPSTTVWYANNVTVQCTTKAAGQLADPSQSSFNLATTVPFGAETAAASTGSVKVCDVFKNCSTAGPYIFMVDEKAPTITITTPPSGGSYQLNATVNANYSCVDGGSGINPSACVGTVPSGNKINTASIGSFQFNVKATDRVGNMSSLTDTYTVGFGNACLLYNPNLAIKRGLPVAILIRLCDAAGKNVSKSTIKLHAVQLVNVGTSLVYPILRDNNNDLDDDFQFVPIVNAYAMLVKTNGLPAGRYNLVYTATGDTTQHTISFLLVN